MIKPKHILGIVLIIIIIITTVFITKSVNDNSEESAEPEIITQVMLEDIIKVSQLNTFEAIYNGVVKIPNEKKPEKVDYYVSYDATVKAGIDFELIDIDVDQDKKIIEITLPQVQINDVNVKMESLDYIFENKKADTENVSGQAYQKCIDDAEKESAAEQRIYELAEQNAENIIEALIIPFIEQLDEEYELEIK